MICKQFDCMASYLSWNMLFQKCYYANARDELATKDVDAIQKLENLGKMMHNTKKSIAYYHLPGLFEFYELYREFLPLFRKHREYFYDWCEIGSIYGAPADLYLGWRPWQVSENMEPEEVLELMQEYGISSRLTFSNSLLREEHLSDKRCNELCALFKKNVENKETKVKKNGVIVYSDLLLEYLKKNYPGLVFCLVNNESVDRF